MKFRSYILIAISLFAVIGVFLSLTGRAYANSVCTDDPPACVYVEIPYTYDYKCLCDQYGFNCQTCQQTTIDVRCTIPQAGGGSCQCCFNDGCYLDCPSINPGSGGGGDDDTAVEPTLAPGVTPTLTPTPAPGTITAVARAVTTNTACAAVSNSTTGISGTSFSFSASSANQPTPQTQADNTPVVFSSQPAGSYTISYTLPSSEWTIVTPCIYQNGVLTAYGQNASLTGGSTLEWRFGFTRGAPWVQTQGGDVYAATTLRSYIPSVTPRVFNVDGEGGYPGVVSYGGSYDFDSDWISNGGDLVSSENWLVNATNAQTDYYDFFYRRFGSPATPTTNPAFSNLLAVTKPDSSETPYYVVGDMTTSGNWSVSSGESIVILVDGNVTIGGRINVTGNGFIALIAKGNITVSSSVGTTAASTTPVVEGVYVTSPTGIFLRG